MSIPKLEFPPFQLPPEAEALREEVRAFLKETLPTVQERATASRSWTTRSRRVQPGAGRARLDRHHLAEEVRRPRAELPRALCRHRGDPGPQRAGRPALARRPPVGTAAAALRQRGAAPVRRAAHRARRMLFLHRHERAGFRLRPRLGAHPRRARAGRLSRQRHQGLDLGRASQPLLRRAGAHLRPARRPAQGAEPAPDRPQDAGHRPASHHQPGGAPRLERGDVHRLLRSRKAA